MKNTGWKARNILTVMVVLLAASAIFADFVAAPPDWRYRGGETASVTAAVDDVVYDGARAQVLRIKRNLRAEGGASEAGIVSQEATELDLAGCQAVTFKARFTDAACVWMQLKGRGINERKQFSPLKDVAPIADGFYAFRWDLGTKLQPPDVQVAEISFAVDAAATASAQPWEIEIIDLVFERDGRTTRRLDTVAPPQWTSTGKVVTRDVPLQGWQVDDAHAADAVKINTVSVTRKGERVEALQLTYTHGKTFSPVSLPFTINADTFNVLTFEAKVETPPDVKKLANAHAPLTGWYSYQYNAFFDNFGVGLQDSDGVDWTALGVPRTHFLQHIDVDAPIVDGFKQFRWDMKHENPTGNKGFDLEDVVSFKWFYDNRKIAPGQKVVITIIAPTFVQGTARTGGDMARYAEFEQYIRNYQPDYSDSSKYLGPPEVGRLASPLPLVDQGRPLAEIVGSASVWGAEGNAVLELYNWLFRLTGGVELPVTAKPSEHDNVKLLIGRAHAADRYAQDLKFLEGSDGCAIRTHQQNVYIFGATPKGTLNGVYTFLEGNSDVIWPRSSDALGAVYTADPNLSVQWGDYRHRPPARNWGWMSPRTHGSPFHYQVRNRANYLGLRSSLDYKYWGLFMEEGGGHNLHSWIPFRLFKTHPEYWALIDGKRQHPNGYKNQICMTNKAGKEIFIDQIVERIQRTPQWSKADCFNIKIEDNWGVCECDECVRPIRLPDGSILASDAEAFRSTQFFMFLNAVANAIHNRGWPDKQIGTYIYFFTVPTPRIPTTAYLRPYFCDYVRKDHKQPIFSPINDIWWRTLQQWTAISNKVVIREYTGIYTYFRPMAEIAAFDIRAELDAGAYEFTSESLPYCSTELPNAEQSQQMDVSFLEYWLILRLYWDPHADVEQLRKYAIRRTFREAAPQMERFFGAFRELYFAEKRTSDFEEDHETLRLVARAGKAEALRSLLNEALQRVEHPVSRNIITLISKRYDTWLLQR